MPWSSDEKLKCFQDIALPEVCSLVYSLPRIKPRVQDAAGRNFRVCFKTVDGKSSLDTCGEVMQVFLEQRNNLALLYCGPPKLELDTPVFVTLLLSFS